MRKNCLRSLPIDFAHWKKAFENCTEEKTSDVNVSLVLNASDTEK